MTEYNKNARIFGNTLYAIRKERGLPRTKMADDLGVSLEKYRQYESAKYMPRISTLCCIAAKVGVWPTSLIGGDERRLRGRKAEELEEDILSNIARRIGEYRTMRGLTQAQLGEIVGINGANIGRYEAEKVTPTMGMACRIADAMGVTLLQLMGGSK